MKRIAIISLLPLALTACGGGGDLIPGLPATPPTPTSNSITAKAPINANPTQPTANESFVNDAVTGTMYSSNTGLPNITSLGTSQLSVAYDATAKAYTLTAQGNTATASAATLLPTDPTPAYPGSIMFQGNSTPGSAVYGSPTAGGDATVEQIVLNTNAAPSVASTQAQALVSGTTTAPTPDLQLSYVSAGQWIKATVSGANLLNATVTQFVYGAYTTDAQMPRTGSANYGVTINALAVAGTTGNLFAATINGSGIMTANFGAGTITLDSTYMTQTVDPNGTPITNLLAPHALTATATMSSSVNSFSGTFSFADTPATNGNSPLPLVLSSVAAPLVGGLNGKFYGPAAQEVGATFSGQTAQATLYGNPTTAMLVGTIVGSRGTNTIK